MLLLGDQGRGWVHAQYDSVFVDIGQADRFL